MKYLIILIAILLLGCRSNEDKTLLFLNESIVEVNTIIENERSNIYVYKQVAQEENPNLDKELIHKMESIELITSELLEQIETFKMQPNKEKDFDTEKLYVYDSLVNVALEDTSIFHENIRSCWRGIVFNEQFNNKTVLNLLSNRIQLTSYWINYEYYNQLVISKFKYNKLKAAVIPKSNYLYQNETFTSGLYLLAYDSTMNMQVELDGEKLKLKDGVAFYYDSICNDVGTFIKKGIVRIQDPEINILRQYPFSLKYKVIEK